MAFCLMPNHYHLVVRAPDANLSNAMQYLNSVYSQWWNHRHQRCGHVFQGRFKAQVVQRDRYLLAVFRYVVLNPVRGGLVANPKDWKWSSYRASINIVPVPDFLDRQTMEQLVPHAGPSGASDAFRLFVHADQGQADVGRLIRRETQVLGDPTFVKSARQHVSGHPSRRSHVLRRFGPAPTLAQIFRGSAGRVSRNALIVEAYEEHGYSLVEIGAHLGMNPSYLGNLVRKFLPRGPERPECQATT
jgi:hypothetical protein